MDQHYTDIRALGDQLRAALVIWAQRDDTIPQAEVRQAGRDAVSAIDDLTRVLYETRVKLVGEIRESDDAAMRRSGELLDRLRAERNA